MGFLLLMRYIISVYAFFEHTEDVFLSEELDSIIHIVLIRALSIKQSDFLFYEIKG